MKSRTRTYKKKRTRRVSNSQADYSSPIFTAIAVIAFLVSAVLTYFIVLKGLEYNKRVFSWSMIALFSGLLLESYLIFRNLKSILNRFTISFLLSHISFLPGKGERTYIPEHHFRIWLYVFLISFIVGVIILRPKHVTTTQTEGTTLLHSLALIYWLYDYRFFENIGTLKGLSLVVILGGIALSVHNAFTKIDLDKSNRLLLSVWSSVILMCFAVDNIIAVFSNGDIDQQADILSSIEVAIQYFIVGISSIYVVQNIIMLFAFLPQKQMKYKQTLHVAKKMHLDRYSELQVSSRDALFCVLFCTVVFVTNTVYQFLPRHTMIWITIVTFPILLQFQHRRRPIANAR